MAVDAGIMLWHDPINHVLGFRCLNDVMLTTPLPQFATALPLQQSPAYARTLRALGREVRLFHRDGVGQMMITSRNTRLGTLRGALRGPLWDSDDPTLQATFLRDANVHLCSPEDTARGVMRKAGFWPFMTGGYVGHLALTQDLAAAMHPKWRNAWRKSQRSAIRIESRPFERGRDMWIMSLDRAQQRAMGYRGYPRPFTLEYAIQNPDAAMTYVAYLRKSPIAAMIFLLHHPSATYHIGWSGEDGRRTNAHHLMLISAAQDFAERGLTTLDLGQIDTRRTPGLARFKLGAGAIPKPLGGTWLRRPRWRG